MNATVYALSLGYPFINSRTTLRLLCLDTKSVKMYLLCSPHCLTYFANTLLSSLTYETFCETTVC